VFVFLAASSRCRFNPRLFQHLNRRPSSCAGSVEVSCICQQQRQPDCNNTAKAAVNPMIASLRCRGCAQRNVQRTQDVQCAWGSRVGGAEARTQDIQVFCSGTQQERGGVDEAGQLLGGSCSVVL
jgi:hypothetical protein